MRHALTKENVDFDILYLCTSITDIMDNGNGQYSIIFGNVVRQRNAPISANFILVS